MEITVFVLLSVFAYLLFYLTHISYREDIPNLRTIELRLLTGFFFIALGVSVFYLSYLVSNGSSASLTVYVYVAEPWQRALMMGYILFGILNIGLSYLDALEFRSYKRSMAEADDVGERSITLNFGEAN